MKNLATEIIKKSININRLPSRKEVEDEIENKYDGDGYDCLFYAFTSQEKIVILDGTEIELTDFGSQCIECKSDQMNEFYYYIPSIETYICLDCGSWLKYHTELFNEVYSEYEDVVHYEEKLLPVDWDDNGVKAYFRNGIKYLIDKENKYHERMAYEEVYSCYEEDESEDDDEDYDDDEYYF